MTDGMRYQAMRPCGPVWIVGLPRKAASRWPPASAPSTHTIDASAPTSTARALTTTATAYAPPSTAVVSTVGTTRWAPASSSGPEPMSDGVPMLSACRRSPSAHAP